MLRQYSSGWSFVHFCEWQPTLAGNWFFWHLFVCSTISCRKKHFHSNSVNWRTCYFYPFYFYHNVLKSCAGLSKYCSLMSGTSGSWAWASGLLPVASPGTSAIFWRIFYLQNKTSFIFLIICLFKLKNDGKQKPGLHSFSGRVTHSICDLVWWSINYLQREKRHHANSIIRHNTQVKTSSVVFKCSVVGYFDSWLHLSCFQKMGQLFVLLFNFFTAHMRSYRSLG